MSTKSQATMPKEKTSKTEPIHTGLTLDQVDAIGLARERIEDAAITLQTYLAVADCERPDLDEETELSIRLTLAQVARQIVNDAKCIGVCLNKGGAR